MHSVDQLDLSRYTGLWYEIGRLPLKWQDTDSRDVTADYTAQDGGSLRVDNRCLDDEGKPTQSVGEAEPVEGEPGQLTVTFLPEVLRWIPFTKGDYWVLKIDPEYRVSLVGTPDHKHLWLLSRTPELAEPVVQEYLHEARAQGFELDEWMVTPQSGSRVTDAQLAKD